MTRKRSGNPPSSSERPKGRERKRWKGSEHQITPEKRRSTWRETGPPGIILSSEDGGIIAAMCQFHVRMAREWDEFTLKTRVQSCEECQELTLAVNQSARKSDQNVVITPAVQQLVEEIQEDE